jgi:hypothetical protein
MVTCLYLCIFEMVRYEMIDIRSPCSVEREPDICHARREPLIKAFCVHVQWEKSWIDVALCCWQQIHFNYSLSAGTE